MGTTCLFARGDRAHTLEFFATGLRWLEGTMTVGRLAEIGESPGWTQAMARSIERGRPFFHLRLRDAS